MTINITKLLKPEVYNHPCHNIKLIETHISWVILTGDLAYKIKKPVNFGFLDFSTLEKRKHFCEQELQLNRRLAADLYLDVVAITGTSEEPHIAGNTAILEYAVKMRQFPQSAQLDNMLASGKLKPKHMDTIANMVADFHQSAEVAGDASPYGNTAGIYQPVAENFQQINEHLDSKSYTDQLEVLSQWSNAAFKKQQTVMAQRKTDGFIRHCHGDMHLRNMLWLHNKAMAFDCIEFNEKLSWIDVISEIAFLIMDLQHRQQQILAKRFLNRYLEISGDYAGLSVLVFYLCYRALVRAKVCALRLAQSNVTEREHKKVLTEFESYLALADSYTKPASAKLIIMRGLSASGKSTVSQHLVDKTAVIRIRSDIERKRLFNVSQTNKTAGEIDSGMYSTQASQQTYKKLLALASDMIIAGYSVIVDAAFLKYEQRELFQKLAIRLSVPYTILQITAPVKVLRQRITQRSNDVSDANLSVLEHQLSNYQPLHKTETDSCISIDTTQNIDFDALVNRLRTYMLVS